MFVGIPLFRIYAGRINDTMRLMLKTFEYVGEKICIIVKFVFI